jgi:hypothetical protein
MKHNVRQLTIFFVFRRLTTNNIASGAHDFVLAIQLFLQIISSTVA